MKIRENHTETSADHQGTGTQTTEVTEETVSDMTATETQTRDKDDR